MPEFKRFLIRITDSLGNVSYLVRSRDGTRHFDYKSASETPLSLANFASNGATKLRHELEERLDPADAFLLVQKFVKESWKNESTRPKVELIN